jgi:hypothetical protein
MGGLRQVRNKPDRVRTTDSEMIRRGEKEMQTGEKADQAMRDGSFGLK